MLLCVQALWAEPEGGPAAKGQTITEQVLNILEVILLEASEQPPEQYSVSLSASWCWGNKNMHRRFSLCLFNQSSQKH